MTLRSRPSRRDVLLANKAALDGLSRMAGREPEPFLTRIPDPPKPRKPSGKRLEKHALREILAGLRSHPHVAFCLRMQSGLFENEDRTIRVGTVGLPDIIGMLRGGVFFGIEVKGEGGTPSVHQYAWIDRIRAAGGKAGFAWSLDDALEIIA